MPSPARLRLATVLAAAALVLLTAPAAAQIVINEIDYDQPGTDAAEFIELKNVSLASVDLDPYTVELVNGSNDTVYDTIDLPSFSLAPGAYYVICANAATVTPCDLDDGPNTNFIQNGAPDAVGLRFSGTLVDAVSYEGNTGAPYTEGSGVGLEDDPGMADFGISRCPDGNDTDQNNVDFAYQPISPGATNACAGAEPVLVINEIDYDQSGTDAAEFVEIANVGPVAVDLDPYELTLVNGSGGGAAIYAMIDLPSAILMPGEYFVVCGDAANVANCDLDVSPNTNLIQNGAPDAVALRLAGAVIDTVSYEGNTGAPYTEGSGSGLEDDPSTDDAGISRFPDGVDTDVNNVDFVFSCITPGAANTDVAVDCGVVPEATLVINEIDYDQPGTDAAEFIELKNVGTDPLDLSSFELRLVNGSNNTVYNTIALPAVSLAAGDYFVVCGDAANVFGCDLDVSPDTNLIQNGSPDAVALFQGATLVDTVSYEGDVPGFVEGSGAGLFDSASGGNDNKGISRLPDGFDSDQNNLDFSFVCITPGEANTSDASDCPTPGPPALVINEIDYDQPGGDSAEFVEIKNRGDGAAELDGVELVLVNGNGGAIYQTIALPAVTLGSGDYFVVCANAATVANCDLDAISSIQNGAPDAVALRFAGVIVDAVSYEGDVPGFVEGSGAGLEDSGSGGEDDKGISRFPDGVDTDSNNVDLRNVCITPGIANTVLDTGCTPEGPALEIFDIQGAGTASPFDGQGVFSGDNAVTCLALDGFFIQTPTARTDGDGDTSDGIFVFTDAPPTVAVGDRVDVAGTAQEFFGFTEIDASSVTVIGTGAVPAPVAFNAAVPSPDPTAPSCAIEFECYEGMRIEITGGTVTGPNQRFGPDPIAEVHIVAGPDRALREPGVEFPGLMMPPIPTWDGNPEVFELDPDKLGLPNQIIPAGSHFDAVGVLGFEFGGYELWPNELVVDPAPLPVAVRPRAATEVTVGTLNLFRLFDDVDDPPSTNTQGFGTRDDFVVSSAEYQRRLDKFSAYILDVLDAPDILGVQEAESLKTLQDLADRIALDDPAVVYTPLLIEGNDVGTIDVGFLVRDNVTVDAVSQLGAGETLTFDGSLLHDRPPLLLEARFTCAAGGSSPIEVLVVHNRSLNGIDDPSDGPRVRQKRLEQAQSIAQMVQDRQDLDPNVRLAVLGDFNAFEFTDGYVDVVGQIKGDFVAAENLLSGPDLVDPNLFDEVLTLPAEERYSFIFRGSAQVLDHILSSQGLAPLVRGTEFGRGNADAAVDLINDAATPLRASDHDGQVLYVTTDCDADGVADDLDVCPGTAIPEGVPTNGLNPNHYALVDGDLVFDTPPGGVGDVFTTADTAGCSCEQIIDALGLGNGHRKHGCSVGVMRNWVALVNP